VLSPVKNVSHAADTGKDFQLIAEQTKFKIDGE